MTEQISTQPTVIARHPTDIPGRPFAELLEEGREMFALGLANLSWLPVNALGLFDGSLREAGLLQMLQPDSPEILVPLRRAARAIRALCLLGAPGEGPLLLDIEGPPVTVTGRLLGMTTVGHFIDGVYAALAAGERDVLHALTEVDVWALRSPGIMIEEYSFHQARALQGFLLGADWTHESALAAMQESKPERLRYGTSPAMVYLSSPEMELMTATTLDPPSFNAVLVRALENHRHYYGSVQPNPDENQSRDPRGFIALGPLAFAAAMARRGWPITVRSDYLPQCVLATASSESQR